MKNQRLIQERKMGQNLDWSFDTWDNGVKNAVKAHKSIVLKYSPHLRQQYAHNQKNCSCLSNEFRARSFQILLTFLFIYLFITAYPLYYPSRIVDTLMTLLYEQSVNVNKSDYAEIMSCAKALQIDKLFGILQKFTYPSNIPKYDSSGSGYRR